jgi:hypothetical protein
MSMLSAANVLGEAPGYANGQNYFAGILTFATLGPNCDEWIEMYEQKLQFGCSHSTDCQQGLPRGGL